MVENNMETSTTNETQTTNNTEDEIEIINQNNVATQTEESEETYQEEYNETYFDVMVNNIMEKSYDITSMVIIGTVAVVIGSIVFKFC